MGNYKLIVLAFAGIVLGACNSNKNSKAGADTSATNSSMMDTAETTDTGTVAPADSTHSFRNDRGTDSVSAGRGTPEKP